jgi:predicted dehydrogenase
MTLSWGIAGTGRIARSVGALIAAHPDMRVVAVASRSQDRAAALAGELSAEAAYPSYEELARDPQVQAVYVATPHARHAPVVEPALRAGRAVLCEKPLTASLAETERLVALAADTGAFLMEAMWMRFNPLVQQLRALVAEGRLGTVRSLSASFGFAAAYDAAARLWNPELGGGALLDLGVYVVDLARLLLGDPDELVATGTLAATGVDATARLSMRWANDARALLDVSLLTALPGTAHVIGTDGTARLGPTFHAPTTLSVHVTGTEPVETTLRDRNAGFVGELEEVARCVAAGEGHSEVMPLTDTVATMRLLDEAARGIRASSGA